MPNRRLLLALAAACATAGCSDPSGPRVGGELVGRWVTESEPLRPAGSHQYYLTFGADGRFTGESVVYAVYPGQRADELSAYVRTTGTFAVAGDRVTITPDALVTWDRTWEGTSPLFTVQRPYPYTGFLDDLRFRVEGDALRLDYLSYPADAPEPTTMRLGRVR